MTGCVHTMVELRKLHIRYVSTYSLCASAVSGIEQKPHLVVVRCLT